MTNKMMNELTLHGESGRYVRHIGVIFHTCKILSATIIKTGKHKIKNAYQPHFWKKP